MNDRRSGKVGSHRTTHSISVPCAGEVDVFAK